MKPLSALFTFLLAAVVMTLGAGTARAQDAVDVSDYFDPVHYVHSNRWEDDIEWTCEYKIGTTFSNARIQLMLVPDSIVLRVWGLGPGYEDITVTGLAAGPSIMDSDMLIQDDTWHYEPKYDTFIASDVEMELGELAKEYFLNNVDNEPGLTFGLVSATYHWEVWVVGDSGATEEGGDILYSSASGDPISIGPLM